MAYLTAGDPHLPFTADIIPALAQAGVDIIELGVPFNHPLGDGPTIQRSARRALANRVYLNDILLLIEKLRGDGVKLPIILFSYHNPVFSYGYAALAEAAARAGVSASLIVDLPPEESRDYCHSLNRLGIDTIFLVTPTTSAQRLALINERTRGFCYYVSHVGVTGSRVENIFANLDGEIAVLRDTIKVPIFVGFGIRTAGQARVVGNVADGVIVGSAFVDCIEQASNDEEAKQRVINLAGELRRALDE